MPSAFFYTTGGPRHTREEASSPLKRHVDECLVIHDLDVISEERDHRDHVIVAAPAIRGHVNMCHGARLVPADVVGQLLARGAVPERRAGGAAPFLCVGRWWSAAAGRDEADPSPKLTFGLNNTTEPAPP